MIGKIVSGLKFGDWGEIAGRDLRDFLDDFQLLLLQFGLVDLFAVETWQEKTFKPLVEGSFFVDVLNVDFTYSVKTGCKDLGVDHCAL